MDIQSTKQRIFLLISGEFSRRGIILLEYLEDNRFIILFADASIHMRLGTFIDFGDNLVTGKGDHTLCSPIGVNSLLRK